MNKYVAMLRGINVSGQKQIKMTDLRDLFLALGYTDVITYIQSGNVVFTRANDDSTDVAGDIERRIMRDLGLQVTAIVRTESEMGAVIERNPFVHDGVDPARLHVTFLAAAPDQPRLSPLTVPSSDPDEFQILGREVYLHCPAGYGTTKLSNALWERRLGVAATTRNWNTVTKLFQLASG